MRTEQHVRSDVVEPAVEPAGEGRGAIVTTAVTAVGLAVLFFALASIFGNTAIWDVLGALVVGPALFLFTLPILMRQARREGDRGLMTLLVCALLAKLLGAIVRYILGTNVYHGGADAFSYDRVGTELAEQFRQGDFSTPEGTSGTNFIDVLTGIIYVFIGPTIIGGFLFFSWLGFIGLFLFYRAFTIAVPEGRRRTYARLVFFLPSLLVWPSSIGKESWMMFCLGIAAFGAARMFSGKFLQGLGLTAVGIWWAALPRAHIAAVVGVATGFGLILRKPRKELRQIAPLIKLASLVLVAAAAVFFVAQASQFIQKAGIETEEGFTDALGQVATRSSGGKSNFEAPVVTSPAQLPLAVFTVLFRPTVVDARSPQALAAAAEGTFLAILTLMRLSWVLRSIRLARRRPYVAMAVVMVGSLIIAFSAISNLGILARERVQLLPFYFVLLSIPSKRWLELREKRMTPADKVAV